MLASVCKHLQLRVQPTACHPFGKFLHPTLHIPRQQRSLKSFACIITCVAAAAAATYNIYPTNHPTLIHAMLGLPPAPPIKLLDRNQTSQGQIHTLDVGSKHLIGFRYAGGWLLHRPKDGSLLQLRTLFVHFKPDGHFGPAASAAYRDF